MGAKDIDVQLFKVFPISETKQLRFDVSCYNLANRKQFGMPNVPAMTDVATQSGVAESFGQITNTVNTPRQFQFGFRFVF
jgi:hypothetical protein